MFPRRSSILLLDDDAAIRRLMTLLLKRAGYRVHAVDKGNEAIAALDRSRYDIILLDIMMPTEGGMTVVNHLRKKDPAMLKRVLIVTGTPPAILKSIAGEVAGIVNKPFEAQTLLDAVERAAKS